ncbi:Chaperone protein DnaJ [Trichinella pseudospiralis]
MPKLKKGATPSELVKGVTANRMLTIGRKTEPDNEFTITSQSLPFLFWTKHNATDFTSLSIPSPNGHGSSLENRSSKHRGYC